MKRFSFLCSAAIVISMFTACNQGSVDRDADAKALQATEAQWNQDYASKDVDKIVAHYANDAVLMAPGTPSDHGKDAIRNTIKQMVADPAISLKFQPSKIEVAKEGDIAYTQGSYAMTLTDPRSKHVISDHGSYVTTYRKQPDGTWRAVADIATSEIPPGPSATP
jgi:uncharacterized protein (TIGR02246 family)